MIVSKSSNNRRKKALSICWVAASVTTTVLVVISCCLYCNSNSFYVDAFSIKTGFFSRSSSLIISKQHRRRSHGLFGSPCNRALIVSNKHSDVVLFESESSDDDNTIIVEPTMELNNTAIVEEEEEVEVIDESDTDFIVAATAIDEAAVEEPVPTSLSLTKVPGISKIAKHAIPISVAVVIGTFSMLEVVESLREIILTEQLKRQKFMSFGGNVGHAHGITLLAFLRLGRSMSFFKLLRHKKNALRATHRVIRFKSKAVMKIAKGAAALQTQGEELQEQAEELKSHNRLENQTTSSGDRISRLRDAFVSFLVSPVVAITAAVLAVIACVMEIVDDMKPGAHHGAALLALSEFYYQFRRLKARVKQDRNRTSTWRTNSWMGRLWTRIPVGPVIAIAAAIYAGIELYEDIQPGAHHGVAILALAELVENLNRSKVLDQVQQQAQAGGLSTTPSAAAAAA